MTRLKTTLRVHEALPADLCVTVARRSKGGDAVWIDIDPGRLADLRAAAERLADDRSTYEARNLVDAVDRALRAASKASAKARATVAGELDPEVKATLTKILKRHNVESVKRILAAFDLIGIAVERGTLQWTVRVGDLEPVTLPCDLRGRGEAAPAHYELTGLRAPFGPLRETPEERDLRAAPYAAALRELRVRVARALGAPLPEDEAKARLWLSEHGFDVPPPPKVRRHGDWTCGYCWRTHATDDAGKLVHHGYRRPGIGSIVGDCDAVGLEPWERSTEATALLLAHTEERAEALRRALTEGYGALPVKDKDGQAVWVTPEDPRWAAAERAQRLKDAQEYGYLWGGWFRSIPWLRAALRGWSREATGAVGIPSPAIIDADSEGKLPLNDAGEPWRR